MSGRIIIGYIQLEMSGIGNEILYFYFEIHSTVGVHTSWTITGDVKPKFVIWIICRGFAQEKAHADQQSP